MPALMQLRPIGTLSTPFRSVADCPRNGRQLRPAPACSASILPEFVEGLASLDGFSHLILLYWLQDAGAAGDPGAGCHAGPARLCFTPPFDHERRGVCATRAPWRPNPIGLSVVAFEGFAAPDRLTLRYLDCVDGTALLDIKPYLPTTDAEPAASMGWLAPHATESQPAPPGAG
jgi:tRNA-Thr(GGU) m(6)t(6)A37 methyltransferase TsaA